MQSLFCETKKILHERDMTLHEYASHAWKKCMFKDMHSTKCILSEAVGSNFLLSQGLSLKYIY